MSLREKVKDVKLVDDENIYIKDIQKGMELCTKIISIGEIENKNIKELDKCIERFKAIASENTNKMGIKTSQALHDIRKDVETLISFPELENSYKVAVGGSFSSGKSTFLNKVLGLKNILPRDTDPTTSIPTYIVSSEKEKFFALNRFNKIVSLDKDAIGAISHAFNKKYKLSFAHLLKFLVLRQEKLKYDNLIFLDTPGYSKADGTHVQQSDKAIAKEHLRGADFLIWLVDSQTPITNTDLNFLKTLNLQQPILVVINKADKKLPEDREDLVQYTKESLKVSNISYYDVVAFSSSKNEEYTPTKDVIDTYLKIIASQTTGTKILHDVKKAFQYYLDYCNTEVMELKNSIGKINNMIMEDIDGLEGLIEPTIRNKKNIEKHNKKVELLQQQTIDTVTEILLQSGINILKYHNTQLFDAKFYNKQKSKKLDGLRFPATLHLKKEDALQKFSKLDLLEAKVKKITNNAIYFFVENIENDIMLSKLKVEEESDGINADELFKEKQKVKVQITDNNRCVVIL